jgi:hypothetical protein
MVKYVAVVTTNCQMLIEVRNDKLSRKRNFVHLGIITLIMLPFYKFDNLIGSRRSQSFTILDLRFTIRISKS